MHSRLGEPADRFAGVPAWLVQVVLRSSGQERELDIEVRAPEATLADLVRAATGREPAGAVRVGGMGRPPTCPIRASGLVEGGLLDLGGGFVPQVEPGPYEVVAVPYEVVAVAGLDAGLRWPLSGEVLVGRAAGEVRLDARSISREHCRLAVDGGLTVTDVGARNAVVVDEEALPAGSARLADLDAVVRLGPVDLQVRPVRCDPAVLSAAGESGTVLFARPPREALLAGPAALVPPEPPRPPVAEPFSVAALVGPLLLAGALVGVTGDPRFALLSALSPVLGVGTWWEAKRRAARQGARDQRAYAAALAALQDDVRAAGLLERRRLRQVAPDLAEVLSRATLPSTRLWERRAGDPLLLAVGVADQAWAPPLVTSPVGAAADVLARARLPAAPVTVDLTPGRRSSPGSGTGAGTGAARAVGSRVLGVVGDRAAALAVVRGLLVSASVTCGPADLAVGVFAADPADWAWVRWLPHTRRGPRQRFLATCRGDAEPLLAALSQHRSLVVLDGDALLTGHDAPARTALESCSGIVLASTRDALPAACDQVLTVAADGSATLERLREGEQVPEVLAAGLSAELAVTAARQLARLDDPELSSAGAGLPASVRLLPLLGLERPTADAVRARWASAGPDPGLRAPIGRTESGPFVLDLVRDGAHGLVGGTTGSGKSELLRSLVAALAVHADADHLTFVLIDYKGGAAFDACAALPHVVGLVTDLDEALGARALRALEAELHRRERVLRAAGADNLPDYLALGRPEPLPRLVVVVDEFATLAAELPDFVGALIGVAQRGRTLGVHLLLATQRPSGAVKDDIRANTNLRIALRVQDAADSTDVLGVPLAAQISRDRPGQAYVRLGPGEVVALQTALVTCSSPPPGSAPVSVSPAVFGPSVRPPAAATAAPDGPSDLTRLVEAVVQAHRAAGLAAPLRPWPEPLPDVLPLALPASGGVAVVGLADDPAAQARHPAGWDLAAGCLLLVGVPGSGTTTTLLALGLSLAAHSPPAELELYGLDLGTGGLTALTALPQVADVVTAGDRERQERLLRRLGAELDRRRTGGEPYPRRVVLLLDGLGALRSAFDDPDGLVLLDLLARLVAQGPEVGMWVAATVDRLVAAPPALVASVTARWVFRLADPYDWSALGVARADVPAAVPGRCLLLPERLQAQVGLPSSGQVQEVAAAWGDAVPVAEPVGVLPSIVRPGPPARWSAGTWHLPVGVAEPDLGLAELVVREGEHVLVAGPARSGRSAVLVALASALAAAGCPVLVTGGRTTPLQAWAATAPGARWLPTGELAAVTPADLGSLGSADTATTPAPVSRTPVSRARLPAAPATAASGGLGPSTAVLLVDDAELVALPEELLAVPGLLVVAAGRPDALRSAYGHWTATLRRSRTGLLLRPDVDLDGDLLGARLPRRAPVAQGTARGYLVCDGEVTLVQCATA